ncbi:phage tail protein [Halalkalibaculum sp. DA3122]|uniref:phage tail protein n=1 Tax=unclassified Halalkalibaculum TaxID=2964617 RepID=UPI003753FDF0
MEYPAVGFHFKVEFSGLDGATDNDIRFQEVSGLTAEIGTEELREGGENRFAHRLPQPAKYQNLVLKRGLLTGTALIQWFRDAIEHFSFDPLVVNVSLLNEQGNTLINWNFTGAYPVKWAVSNLDAQKNEVVIDTIELAYQYFTKVVPENKE